jgi:flavin-dependent dehydrogenase
MEENNLNNLTLEDGAKIAVVGGGPAGSFFTYFALDFAQRFGTEINIDIYEAKNFNKVGPAGCNHCGGIVSESLVQILSAEGIVLPSNVIRRGIESYTLHMEQGTTVIDTPFQEQRIASMFRGFGPLGSTDDEQLSFDRYLMELCEKKGARLIQEKVLDMEKDSEGVIVKTKNSGENRYDLVVGSVGLNPRSFKLFEKIAPSFIPPKTTKTYICEFHLGHELINQYFGNSMHVFLLNLNNIKFGALIPKGEYVTLVLLGAEINKVIVDSFVNSKEVRACFPPGMELKSINPCQCFPSINIKNAKSAYSDRVVLIGDSSSSKLYKNGIGAAYITAKAAAKTAIFDGISETDFINSYQPACTTLNRDNAIGKMIFLVTTIIQKSTILKTGLFRMVVNEQKKTSNKRRMSSVLWDTFTGSAPYTGILIRVIHPATLGSLIWNIIMGIFKLITNSKK